MFGESMIVVMWLFVKVERYGGRVGRRGGSLAFW
jgi:hypothetical protein